MAADAGLPGAGVPGDDAVLRRLEDGVAWITLNRPEAGNAITAAMRDQVVAWLEEASADLAVRAVVLTGAARRASAPVPISGRQGRDRPGPTGPPSGPWATPPV